MYYFLSDIHLKNDCEDKAVALCQFFINMDASQTKKVFLLGDIFDLWVANHKVFIKKYAKVVQAIQSLVDRGIEVHYFEGNHDLYLDRFWQSVIGVKTYKQHAYIKLDGYCIRLEHGDQTNPEDVNYLKYRTFLAKPFMNRLAYIIPGKLIDYLGNRASNKSRAENHQAKWDIKSILRHHIQRIYDEADLDVIISGHLHEQVDEELEVGTKKIRNINLGWWQESYPVLKLVNTKFEWLDLKTTHN